MLITFFHLTNLLIVQLSSLTDSATTNLSSSARTSRHTGHGAHGIPGSNGLSDPFRTPIIDNAEGCCSFSFGRSERLNMPRLRSRTPPSDCAIILRSIDEPLKVQPALTSDCYQGLLGQYPTDSQLSSPSNYKSVLPEKDLKPSDKDACVGYIDLMAGYFRKPEGRHAFTLGRTEPNVYVKELQPSFMASMKAWSRAVYEATHLQPAAGNIMQPSIDGAIFADVNFWCCHCRHIDHLRGTTKSDVDCGERFRCVQCGHNPCLVCRFNSRQLECIDNQVRVPLAIWEAEEDRPLPPWICCSCGSTCPARLFRQRHRNGDVCILVFAGSTCSNCKHDCCGGCACFQPKSDAERAGDPFGQNIREAKDHSTRCEETPRGPPSIDRVEKWLQEVLHEQGRPLRQVGPKRQLMRSISVKVKKAIRL